METRRLAPRRGPWTETTRTLIECLRCREVCEDTVTHALRVGGSAAEDERIGAWLDCADVCRTTATFIRRGSALAGRTAGIAADLLFGPLYQRLLVTGEPVTPRVADRLCDLALKALSP